MEKSASKSNNYFEISKNICEQIFGIFLIGYLFFFLIDQIFDDFVSNFINLNYILATVLVFGILTVLLKENNEVKKDVSDNQQNSWKYSILSFFLGFIAAIVIFIQILSLGILLSLFISIISGLLIALISFLLLDFKESKNEL